MMSAPRCLLLLLLPLTASAEYEVIPLQTPPGFRSATASGINDAGVVVGTATGDRAAVIWDGDGNPSILATLGTHRLGEAVAISNSGLVVGRNLDPPLGPILAVLWDRRGNPLVRPPLTGDPDSARRSGFMEAGHGLPRVVGDEIG